MNKMKKADIAASYHKIMARYERRMVMRKKDMMIKKTRKMKKVNKEAVESKSKIY